MKRPPSVAASTNSDRKNVLLVVTHGARRNLRANIFRKHGIEVVCASHTGEARLLWHPGSYDLVIFDAHHDSAAAVELGDEMKASCPGQRVAYLVGKPEYLASSPGTNGANEAPTKRYEETLRQMMANACEALPRRGGFLEATWRMSLARSVTPSQQASRPQPLLEVLHEDTMAPPSITFGEAIRREQQAQEEIAAVPSQEEAAGSAE